MSSKGKRQLPALTGVRFVLALWIVVYHQMPPVETPAIVAVLHTGYTAVTAFFVLSGFVLAYNYDLDRLSSSVARWRFAGARFSRIYPAYLVGLLLMVPFEIYRLASGIQMHPPWVQYGGFVLNVLLLQAWVPYTALTWNFPGWSLSNEALFYASFPFLGAWLWRLQRTSLLLWALAGLWLLSCVAPLFAVWVPAYHWGDLAATTLEIPGDASIWANIIRYNPLLRLPEFCAGIVLARLYGAISPTHWLQKYGTAMAITALALTLLSLSNAQHIPYPLMHNGLLLPLFAALIFGLALGNGWLAHGLSRPSVQLLGNASYSMYILHVPVYAWLGILFRRLLGQAPEGWMWFLTYVFTVIVASCIFFKWAEEPMHRRLRRFLEERITRWSAGAGETRPC